MGESKLQMWEVRGGGKVGWAEKEGEGGRE